MAMIRHPITGVEINEISVTRPRKLDDAEAETARLLRADGHKVQDIAAMLGTNQGRVQDVLGTTGKTECDQRALF
jgi:hypothetical protein